MADGESEQKLIEKYLKQFSIEDCLDEVLNLVLTERPRNPYTALAQAMEMKTLPEIMDIRLYPVLHRDNYAVKAMLETNVGSFSGTAVYSTLPDGEEADEAKDYTGLEQSLREVLIPLDPRNLKQVDDAVVAVGHINPAESLAVSIAACRAAAKFKGAKVFEYIADQVGARRDDMAIPLPVLAVLTRDLGFAVGKQVVQLYPVKASDFDLALDKLRSASRQVSKCKRMQVPPKFDGHGTQLSESTASVEDAVNLVKEVFNEHDLHDDIKLGVRWAADHVLKPGEAGTFASTYLAEGNTVKSGQDVVERILVLWQDLDLCSVDDTLSLKDATALRYLKKRVAEVIYDVKNGQNADKLKYCVKGVGGDAACPLQVVGDCSLLEQIADVEKQWAELPFNAVRISWNRLRTVSEAVEVSKKVKKLSAALVLHSGDVGLVCSEDFDVDFAVGVGASQYHTGGIHSGEVAAKLTRLQDIKRANEGIPYQGVTFRSVG